MPLAQPVHLTQPAWRAIRDEVIAPAGGGPAASGVAGLAAAWEQARTEDGQLVVWLDAEQAAVLAGLLDARPELAGRLGGDPA